MPRNARTLGRSCAYGPRHRRNDIHVRQSEARHVAALYRRVYTDAELGIEEDTDSQISRDSVELDSEESQEEWIEQDIGTGDEDNDFETEKDDEELMDGETDGTDAALVPSNEGENAGTVPEACDEEQEAEHQEAEEQEAEEQGDEEQNDEESEMAQDFIQELAAHLVTDKAKDEKDHGNEADVWADIQAAPTDTSRDQMILDLACAIEFCRGLDCVPQCQIVKELWGEATPIDLATVAVAYMSDTAIKYVQGVAEAAAVESAMSHAAPGIYELLIDCDDTRSGRYIGKSDRNVHQRMISHRSSNRRGKNNNLYKARRAFEERPFFEILQRWGWGQSLCDFLR